MNQRLRRKAAPLSPSVPLKAPARGAPPWVHVQANRRIDLAGKPVAYLLQRSRRRTIGFRIDSAGLTVRAPQRSTLADIDDALRSKTDWICAKLAQAQQRARLVHASRMRWHDGARIAYLGGQLQLQIKPIKVVQSRAVPAVQLHCDASGNGTLQLHVAPGADELQIAALAQEEIKRQARRHFTARLDHFAPQLGVRWQRLRLSSARTRWGSASTRGTISLHWRLMQLAPAVVDYVVVHELAHLLEMNHSARFWAHVGRILPNYAELRAALKAADLPPWT